MEPSPASAGFGEDWRDNWANDPYTYVLNTVDPNVSWASNVARDDMLDLDGDGLVDRVELVDCGQTILCWNWRRNTGTAFVNEGFFDTGNLDQDVSGLSHTYFDLDNANSTTETMMIDVNGDGRPDYHDGTNAYLNNGTGLEDAVPWPLALGLFAEAGPTFHSAVATVDMNGDGLPDQHAGGICSWDGGATYFNLGDQWQQNDGIEHAAMQLTACSGGGPLASPETGVMGGTYSTLADMNGDGVVDLVVANSYGGQNPFNPVGPHWTIWYGGGDGNFVGFENWSVPGFRWPEAYDYPDSWEAPGAGFDPNPPQGPPAHSAWYFVRFSVQDNLYGETTFVHNAKSDLLDLTGDGLPDFVMVKGEVGNWLTSELWEHPGPSGLLETVKNELGGVTTIEYTAGPQAARDGTEALVLASPHAPPDEDHTDTFIVERARPGTWLVTGITVDDGRATPLAVDLAETLRYHGPRFDADLRESVGYRLVESVDGGDVMTRSLFHQAADLKGRLQASETLDSIANSRNVFAATVTDWTALPAKTENEVEIGGSSFVVPDKTDEYTYKPGDTAKFVKLETTRSYDPTTGNLKTEAKTGAGVTQYSETTYAENWVDWLVSYPKSVQRSPADDDEPTQQSEPWWPTVEYQYDGLAPSAPPTGGLVTVRRTSESGDEETALTWREEHWEYDSYGNQRKYFDGNAVEAGAPTPTRDTIWESVWQTFPESITDGELDTARFGFSKEFGKVTGAIDPAGFLRCFTYDTFGRLGELKRRTTSATSYPTAWCNETLSVFAYWSIGDPAEQSIQAANFYHPAKQALWNIRYFDGLGRVYEERKHAGGTHENNDVDYFVTLTGWDARGQQSCQSLPFRDPLGVRPDDCAAQTDHPSRTTAFDALGRPTQTKLHKVGGGSVPEQDIAYSVADMADAGADDELTSTVTTHGDWTRVVKQGLDPWGKVVATEEGSHAIEFVRDALRRVTGVLEKDENGLVSTTAITYNHVGQRLTFNEPGAPGPRSYVYDKSGNLTEDHGAGSSTEVQFKYDAANRLRCKDAAPLGSCSGGPGEGDAEFVYQDGRLSILDMQKLDVTYFYLLTGELQQETKTFGGVVDLTYSFLYGYDLMGRNTLSILPGGVWPARHYDGALPESVEHFNDDVSTFFVFEDVKYHDSGALEQITYPQFGGVPLATNYTYDDDTYRLKTALVSYDDGGTPEYLQDLTYVHDTAGNLITVTDGLGDLSQGFEYDDQFRLQKVTAAGTHAQYFDDLDPGRGRDFGYSTGGNLTEKGGLTIQYGQLPGVSSFAGPHAAVRVVKGDPEVEEGLYIYDENGAVTKMKRKGSWIDLERDDNGWVTKTCSAVDCVGGGSGSDVHYQYDASGARVRKIQGSSVDRLYVSPGFEVDAVGSGKHEIHYHAEGRRIATVKRTGLASTASSGNDYDKTVYYHSNNVGSNTLVTDSTGAEIQESVMDPFGELLNPGGQPGESDLAVNAYLFTDQERDAETGLDYFGARYYDPWIGRFMAVDPESLGGITFARSAVDTQQTNLYSYARNSPSILRDPTGRFNEMVCPGDPGGCTRIIGPTSSSPGSVTMSFTDGANQAPNPDASFGAALDTDSEESVTESATGAEGSGDVEDTSRALPPVPPPDTQESPNTGVVKSDKPKQITVRNADGGAEIALSSAESGQPEAKGTVEVFQFQMRPDLFGPVPIATSSKEFATDSLNPVATVPIPDPGIIRDLTIVITNAGPGDIQYSFSIDQTETKVADR